VSDTGWRIEHREVGAVAIAWVGPFELRAYRNCFIVTGPQSAVTGPAPSLADARHLAADALRRRLAGLADGAIEGYSVAALRAALDLVERGAP
jgi:hypothetical protein